MFLIYNILLTLAVLLGMPVFCIRIFARRKYRKSFAQKIGLKIPQAKSKNTPQPIWIHALSVGETRSAVPLVKHLADTHPDIPIVFSTSTETGQLTAKRELGHLTDRLLFAPMDIYPAVVRIVGELNPRLFVLVETDLWPNLLWHLKKSGIPAVLVNGRISESSFRMYYAFRFFTKTILNSFSYLGMQAPIYKERMDRIGVSPQKVCVGGNLKCDQDHHVLSGRERKALNQTLGWPQSSTRILVAGSTHDGEEHLVLQVFAKLYKSDSSLRLIIAPRDPNRSRQVSDLCTSFGLPCKNWSEKGDNNHIVVIVDTLGDLPKLYSLGVASFVGGSLVPEGGHNPLEPAAQKKPVFFGPHMDDFPDIVRFLVEAGGAQVVHQAKDLYQAWHDALANPEQADRMGEKAFTAWKLSRGSVNGYLSVIEKYL